MILFAGPLHDFIALLPWSKIKKQKRSIREIFEQRRRIYNKTRIAEDSQKLVERICHLACFKEAKTVMLYKPIHNEINLQGILDLYKDQKTLLLPVTHRRSIKAHPYTGEENLKHGKYRISEPKTPPYQGVIDLILVPGVVFDKKLHRIGRGGGFYDKFLRQHPHAIKIGVGYDFQIYKQDVPHTFLDTRLDGVITPSKSIGCSFD